MNNYVPPIEVNVHIYRVLETGVAFATRADDGTNVYIGSMVAGAAGVSEGEIRSAKLIPNTNKNTTPWFATFIEPDPGAMQEFDVALYGTVSARSADEAVRKLRRMAQVGDEAVLVDVKTNDEDIIVEQKLRDVMRPV